MTSKSLTHLVFGVLFGCLFLQTAMAQISIGGKPYSFALRTHTVSPPPVLMPGINIGKLEAEDLLDEQAGLAPRFGDLIEVSLNTNNSGVWETLPDGGRLWRLSIMAAGAKSINLLYDDFYLPDGGVLYIYSADRKHVIGGFTSANNKADRIFATGLVYSDHIVLEYYEPAEVIAKRAANNVAEEASISINYVVHGYRFIEFNPNDLVKAFGSSGSCNVNTICSQGDNWRDQIKSVVMLLSGGSRFCTGYLVNNTAQDCRPLLLTANHCLGTADAISSPSVNTWTFMWRYESPNCTPNTDGPTNMTTNGGTVLANPGSPGSIFSSDFALIELAENPKTAGYDVYFAGFDATTTAPSSATGIHHPSGDVKKISMENAALTGTLYGSTSGTATHWRVADWDSGTTEPGSSGSPIFSDATKRAMGFLSGGGAACGNDFSDWYGSLGYSWTNGGASDSRRRLNAHLDPGGLATFVDGSANPCNAMPPVACTGTTYSSAANLNLAIPDNNPAGVSSTITVATVATVTELKCVTVNLTHTWTGDLVATLTHVSSGTSVQLFRRLNASTSTAVGESSNLSGVYTFCATGASFATAANGGANDYIIPSGIYAQSSASAQATPAQNTNTYTNFVGLSLNGDWRLTIADYSGDDTGTLSNWNFEACSDASTCPTFSAAPANVSIVNSTCGSGCTLTGGSITAPTGTPCPAGSTLQYNVNNSGWTTTLPDYNQSGPVQSIRTRCACDNDANNVSAESNQVSTIPGTLANPVVPANGAATVACPALATQPTPPVVTGCDGSSITPSSLMVTNNPNPLTCEGTRTYTWTYSCGATSSTWSFVYTIERNPFTVPANGAATVNSPTLATQPTPPTVTSNCGEVLTPSGPVVTNVPDPIVCTGTRIYAWTYTDCEGNTAVWSFVYTIIDNTPPMATCHNQTITFNGQESITLNANDLVTVSDNCGTPSITLSPSFITCQQVGQIVPVVITVKDASNNTVTCTATITVGGLPCGWSQNPNGVNCANGNSIAYNAATGVYTATSTNCFYGPPFTGDATAFAQRTLCGDGSITALVTGITPLAGGWAGIVMRENNTAGAKKVQLMTNLGSDHRREFRTTTNGSAQMQQFPSQSRYWLRITRVGNQFTMFVSSNGVNWFPAGAQNIVMPSCIQMGLVATNYTANSTVTATFSNVSFTGSNSGLGSPFTPDVLTPLHSPLTPEFDVYPNPTNGELNVDLTHYVGRAVRFEVYSLEGKLLQFNKIDEVQTTVVQMNMSDLTTGMYLIKVKSAGLPDAVQKVVLQRK